MLTNEQISEVEAALVSGRLGEQGWRDRAKRAIQEARTHADAYERGALAVARQAIEAATLSQAIRDCVPLALRMPRVDRPEGCPIV